MIYKRLVLILFFFAFIQQAQAEYSGRVKLTENNYWISPVAPAPQTETEMLIEFENKNILSENWRYFFQPKAHLFQSPHPGELHTDFDTRNTYLERKWESFYLQVGSFIKNWEGTDGLNPMDIATMKSYRDPVNQENLGSWGLAASSKGTESWTWDLLYIPVQTSPRLPLEYSGWWPRHTELPLQADNTELIMPNHPVYQIDPQQSLNSSLNNNYGARIQKRGDNWDFAIAGFEGASQLPLFRPTINGNLVQTSPTTIIGVTNPIQIRPIVYRRTSVAALSTYTHESWIYRIAGRHDNAHGSDPLLLHWSEQFVGGVEKTITTNDQPIILSLQYAYERKPDFAQGLLYISDPFENSVLAGLRWPQASGGVFLITGLYDLSSHANYTSFEYQKRIYTHWLLALAGDRMSGPADSLLGTWHAQGRGHISASYEF